MRPINMLVVHCSATRAGQNFGRIDIDRWHRQQGWRSIGYHFVIRLNGDIEVGRSIATVGAHAAGFNTNSIGICLIGGLDAKDKACDTFTAAQYEALESLLRRLRGQFPRAAILGHRDLPKVTKDCPCFDVRKWCASRDIAPTP